MGSECILISATLSCTVAKLPAVAIIGRPNTGKSTLFNRLIGRQKAIVSHTPGTTRDHIAHRIEGEEVDYILVDTGGMGGGTDDEDFEDDVHAQSILALENADLIVLTINSREELTGSHFEIANILRKNTKNHVPVIVALTKCDDPSVTDEVLPNYYELGISEDIIPISAPHKLGIDDLEEKVEEELLKLNFTKGEIQSAQHDIPKIAIIGKPNVGKSSIVNAFMSETERKKSGVLVSDVAGTTRDATDTIIKYHEKEYILIDTAGIKRRKQTKKDIETFAYFRSVRSLEECDVCVLVVDATQKLSKQEKRIAGMATEAGKGLIILVNKMDLATKEEQEAIKLSLEYELQFCRFAPVIFCSAETREGLLKLFDQIESVQRNRSRRIPTKDLHNWYKDTVFGQPMAVLAKAKHITQAEEVPPTFVIFVKDPKKVQLSQLRHLENSIRKTFAFEGTPIRWITKS